MIYFDTSVVLAHLFGEDRRPPAELWEAFLVTSRLTEYEVWTRLNARRLGADLVEVARATLDRLAILELTPAVLARALEPFPTPVRTLDALHLASADFLRRQRQTVVVATYDARFAEAARAMAFDLYEA